MACKEAGGIKSATAGGGAMRRLEAQCEACLAVGPEVGWLLDAALEHAICDVAAHGVEATLCLGHLNDRLDLGRVLHFAPITALVLEREEEGGVAPEFRVQSLFEPTKGNRLR